MMKKLLLFTILFVFALSLSNSVFACSPAPQTVVIKCDIKDSLSQQDTTCINDDCSVNVSKNQYDELYLNIADSRDRIYINERYGIQFYGFYRQDDSSSYSELLPYLDSVCVEDLKDITPIFDQEVQNWMSTKKEYFLGGNLVFEPYSADRESELIESKNAFGNCHYEDFKKVSNWFVVTETSRDYCHLTGGGGGMCPQATKSHFQFFEFLLTNPNANTLPYLLGYLIAIGITIGFIGYLFKRKELKLFFKPNKFNIIFTFVLGVPTFLLFLLFTGIEQIIVWTIGYYIFSSLIKYIYLRIRKK